LNTESKNEKQDYKIGTGGILKGGGRVNRRNKVEGIWLVSYTHTK
jgi:hypothetical protein